MEGEDNKVSHGGKRQEGWKDMVHFRTGYGGMPGAQKEARARKNVDRAVQEEVSRVPCPCPPQEGAWAFILQ